MRFYVYIHKRLTDGKVFYVGKGCGKRAWKKSTRNEWWKRIEAKHGRSVEIPFRNLAEDEAFAKEQELIAFYGRENLCNMTAGGEGGIEPSEETRIKQSIARKGRKDSPETIERKRLAGTGRHHSEETKQKLRLANLGKPGRRHTEESRRILSEKGRLRIRTPEHCAAISAAKKGRPGHPISDEHKEKLRQINLGRKHTEEAKKKVSEANKGKKPTPEQLQKIIESNRRSNLLRKKPVECSSGMRFDGAGDAELWLRNNGCPTASRANISSCCTGKLKTAYGFTWKFVQL